MSSPELTKPVVAPADPIVEIQAGSSVPFFCVHGAGGNVINLRTIAERLGPDQAVYGVQSPAVNGGDPPKGIEGMADEYLAAIKAVHPSGPYRLGGYSGGGVVAFEMAQRLTAEGNQPELLVLIDSFCAGLAPARIGKGYLRERLRSDPIHFIRARITERISAFKGKWDHDARVAFYRSQFQPLAIELRDAHLTQAMINACWTYEPSPYAGRTVLYHAEETYRPWRHVGDKRGWDDYLPNLEIVMVSGDHDSVVYEPDDTRLSDHLRQTLVEL